MMRAAVALVRARARGIARWCVISGFVLSVLAVAAFCVADYLWPFPMHRLEQWPVAPRVVDQQGSVLLHVTGSDQQWRNPVPIAAMAPRLIQATVAVEDERFWMHPGVDPIAVIRATGQNVAAGQVVSGASTLTMQVCRMIDPSPRTMRSKVREAFRALQLERATTKSEVMEHYLNIAPYGANIRGVEAAARIYFGVSARDLSLAEAALLAGLPQSPSRYQPDRHPELARTRRNTVLWRMHEQGVITRDEHDDARRTPVRLVSSIRETRATHAAWQALAERPSGGRTTIDRDMQTVIERVTDEAELPDGCDVAVVVIDIDAASVVALVGSADPDDPVDGQVNGALARRSPGSVLKAFIYATAFDARRLDPDSEIPDRPIHRGAWRPTNFQGDFRGYVSCGDALRASLNVPAILVAEAMGLRRCVGTVEACGISLPRSTAQRSGLSIVTGSTEVRLLDLVDGFATLGRGGIRKPVTLWSDRVGEAVGVRVLSAHACHHVSEILSTRGRGDAQSPWFMWKTGTSSRHRDAWAVGHNGRYAVGVWVGRFNGVGSTDLLGAEVAEPILMAILSASRLRRSDCPPVPEPLAVTRPLEFRDPDAGLRIEQPYDRARIVPADGPVTVTPRANRSDVQWFLDGALVSRPTLELGSGQYRLRCVDATGRSAAVTFSVGK